MKKPTLKKRLTFDPEESRSYVKIMLISGVLLLAATLILLTVVKNAVEVEPGWYSVDSAEREDFPLYDSGIHFTYYCDGDSTVIRTEQKKLAAAYSEKLLEIRKLLDPKQSFGDLVNLAWLNAHPNQTATLDEPLFDILRDAAAANATGPYAGALWSEWQTMIVSSDAAAYDPLVDPDARARIRELADAANAPGAAMLELDETNHTACLRLSEDYLAAAEAGEYGPALDLGYLTEAYALLYVRAELEAEGWKTGYFRLPCPPFRRAISSCPVWRERPRSASAPRRWPPAARPAPCAPLQPRRTSPATTPLRRRRGPPAVTRTSP